MKIHNVRLGFATNSSSTHSVILTNSPISDDDLDRGFQWNHFTAGSLESKSRYLAATLYSNLREQVSKDIAYAVIRDWVGISVTPDEYGGITESIDHQSIIGLPLDYDRKGINKEFFDALTEFMLRPGVAILGGNDNGDKQHPLLNHNKAIDIPSVGGSVVRKDKDYWTFFDPNNGTKIRFSFDTDITVTKSDVPELVDLKITDYCSKLALPIQKMDYHGNPVIKNGVPEYEMNHDKVLKIGIAGGGECKYCYQGSSPNGMHAPTARVNSILYKLASEEVFEVAIGGGEPTQHPDFCQIITTAKHYGITPNFTTKSLAWLKESWAKTVLDNCGGFAYSVNNHKQIKPYVTALQKLDYPKAFKRLYIHYVLGTTTFDEYKKILDEAAKYHIQVTLLGYKTNGRGSEFKPYPHEKWLDRIIQMRAEHKYIRIGIDTAISNQYSDMLKEEGISDILYHMEEGKFSCYIDAVTNQIAPSSYVEKSAYSDFNESWITTYQTY